MNEWRNRGEYENEYFVPEHFKVASVGPNAPATLPFSNIYPIEVSINGVVRRADPGLNVGVAVYTESWELLFWTLCTDQRQEDWPQLAVGPIHLRALLPARILNEGTYRVELIASLHCRAWLMQPNTNTPSVTFAIQGGLSDSPYWDGKRPGLLGPVIHWQSTQSAFVSQQAANVSDGDLQLSIEGKTL